ncbi:MAG: lytic murein transglycosylase [Mesorhizobium sp.]|nr:MAG: lytic murein transglycosylase [Mesorhizobium sp.]TIX26899.1 MAG: lytic murein transglycosylase [Mesorhizobium sp.]
MPKEWRQGTPLCPAGHLPLKGGDRMSRLLSPITNAARWAVRPTLPISPLEREMAGRPEGGV